MARHRTPRHAALGPLAVCLWLALGTPQAAAMGDMGMGGLEEMEGFEDMGGIPGLGDDFGLGDLGDIGSGIGPGEDFGDYEDKYSALSAAEEAADAADAAAGGADVAAAGADVADPLAAERARLLDEDLLTSHFDGVVDLDAVTFGKLNDGGRRMLLVMHAPWDKACKAILPVVKELGPRFAPDKTTLVAKVDVDRFDSLAKKYDISSYSTKRKHKFPQIYLFPPGDTAGIRYKGEITVDAITKFVMETGKAGIVEDLHPLVAAFLEGSPRASREAVIKRVDDAMAAMAQDQKEAGAYYRKVMASILEKGEGYVRKEAERLSKILQKGNMQPEQLLGFYRRVNVLKVFANPPEHDEL